MSLQLKKARHVSVLLLCLSFLTRATGQDAAKQAPSLEWECHVTSFVPGESGTTGGHYLARIVSVSLIDGDSLHWTSAPSAIQRLPEVKIYGGKDILVNTTIKVKGIGGDPYLADFFINHKLEMLANEIGFACEAGFFLFDRQTGELLIHQPYDGETRGSSSRMHLYFFLEQGDMKNEYAVNGEVFTARCGDFLFHASRGHLYVYSRKYALLKKHTLYDDHTLTSDIGEKEFNIVSRGYSARVLIRQLPMPQNR